MTPQIKLDLFIQTKDVVLFDGGNVCYFCFVVKLIRVEPGQSYFDKL